MKYILTILFFITCSFFSAYAQENSPATEQQLENLTDQEQTQTEDDSYWQELEQFKKNPVDLNIADESELKELRIITDLQIENLISYRKLFGKFIDKYELQAVPSWDVSTIRKLLPFITISSPVSAREDLGHRFRKGDHSLLLRVSQVLERSKGFEQSTTGTKYSGSPQKIFFRYRYGYKDLLQFGIVGDKDAGEQFFRGSQKQGFDFYSFHLFVRKLGIVQSLAIGDFTVNMGQGLIQWQSLAFKKSSDAMAIKRQSPILHPYSSAGEFYFHRGIGITIKKRNIEATVFGSLRKLNANLVTDAVSGEQLISSFLTSGNNRTPGEVEDKSSLGQLAFGANIKYVGNLFRKKPLRWHMGINAIYYRFSLPISKSDDPYNLYALNGDRWYNFSVDYSCTYRNIHFFGEAAIDKNLHKGFINGILISVDPRVDISILHRSIDKAYQAVSANSFTESTSPSNENGIYAGITIRPSDAWRLDSYADIYRFPWLKYLVDAPSYGKDFLLQLSYTPNKQTELYIRYRNETKQVNQPGELATGDAITSQLIQLPKQDLRLQVNYKISSAISLRNRVEALWYDNKNEDSETGFLAFFDILYKPLLKKWSAVWRWQHFETDSYNSRLYAYENDVLYSYSIPVFYGKGWGYYVTLSYDITKKLAAWLRFSQTVYANGQIIGSGLDEISGNKRTEVKVQVRYVF